MRDEKGVARTLAGYVLAGLAALVGGLYVMNRDGFEASEKLEPRQGVEKVVESEPLRILPDFRVFIPGNARDDKDEEPVYETETEYEVEDEEKTTSPMPKPRTFSLYDIILMNEGREPWVYDDATGKRLLPGQEAKGNRTVGIGFNLERIDAREQIEALGLNFEDIYYGKHSLNEEQINTLWGRSNEIAEQTARKYAGSNFDKLDENTRKVLTVMAFQMSPEKLANFKNLKREIDKMNYQGVAREMRDSRWYNQTGKPVYLINMINDIENSKR